MKNLLLHSLALFLLTVCCFTTYAQGHQKPEDKIIGTYWSPGKDAKIEIYKKGQLYYGKSIWMAYPRTDDNNPSAELRTREILGMDLFSSFSYDDGSYTSGKIYDPESGNTYNCKMTLNGDVLRVRGFIGISLLGRTELFTRVK